MQKLFDDLYPNQLDFGKRIVQALEYHHTVIAFAHTQCGKTGSVLAAIHYSNIPLDRIFIITGLSSIDWLIQTKKRIPIKNIFHRNTLDRFFKIVANVYNPLILIDECHIASGKGMSQSKVLKEAGLLNIDNLAQKNNKLCDISATPESILEDLKKWGICLWLLC
jgi:hypothetical protein